MSTPLPPSPFVGLRKPSSIGDVLQNLYLEFAPECSPDDDIPLPVFVADPSPEYLKATEIMPIVKILARH